MSKKSARFGAVAAAACALAFCLALVGCSGSGTASSSEAADAGSSSASEVTFEEPARVMALNGPTGIGMANLAQDADRYSCEFVGATDQVVTAVANGSVDIAAVPTNLASTLYHKTEGGVQMIAVDALGSLYLLENGDEDVQSIADLAGKTVYATGKGANPQYILEYLIEQAGLSVGEDVDVQYLSEHSELAARVASGEADLAMLPEPFVSVAQSKNADVRVAIDLASAWKDETGVDLPMGCVIARTDFIEEHPDEVAAFLADLQASVQAAADDLDGTAQLCVDAQILPSLEVAKAAIPRCSLTCITGDAMREPVSAYLDVLAAANPQSVGGSTPDDAFYYVK